MVSHEDSPAVPLGLVLGPVYLPVGYQLSFLKERRQPHHFNEMFVLVVQAPVLIP